MTPVLYAAYAISLATCLVTLFPTQLTDFGAEWFIRGALAVVALALLCRRDLLLLSPLFLLGICALIFFSLGPELYVALGHSGLGPLSPALDHGQVARAASVIGARGEFLILQFTALCFGATCLVSFLRRGERDAATSRDVSELLPALAPWAAVGVVMFAVLGLYKDELLQSGVLSAIVGERVARDALDGLGPWIAIASLVVADDASIRRGARLWLAAGVALLVVPLLISAGQAKTAAFLVVVGLGLIALRTRFSRRLALAGVAVAVALPLVFSAAIFATRLPTHIPTTTNDRNIVEFAISAVVAKLLLRQTETRYCFESVVAKHYDAAPKLGPGYFAAGLVPRYFWPDKPNLSRGNAYSRPYCKLQHGSESRHSSSITLLGEPIARAGRAGLIAAETTVIIVLAGATMFCFRRRSVGRVSLLAMTPWLIDFDQDFTLYVANGVKVLLYMVPIMLLLIYLGRRSRSSPRTREDTVPPSDSPSHPPSTTRSP